MGSAGRVGPHEVNAIKFVIRPKSYMKEKQKQKNESVPTMPESAMNM